jgi:hypothetical protein
VRRGGLCGEPLSIALSTEAVKRTVLNLPDLGQRDYLSKRSSSSALLGSFETTGATWAIRLVAIQMDRLPRRVSVRPRLLIPLVRECSCDGSEACAPLSLS